MPMDEFVGQQGNKEFVLALSVKDYEEKEFQCPEWKRTRVEHKITLVQTKTSRESRDLLDKLSYGLNQTLPTA